LNQDKLISGDWQEKQNAALTVRSLWLYGSIGGGTSGKEKLDIGLAGRNKEALRIAVKLELSNRMKTESPQAQAEGWCDTRL
jgi:hypothetical protein